MEKLSQKRRCWSVLLKNMFKKDLVDELKGRYVLHWNYRGFEQLPQELLVFGLHVEELYLKGNNLQTLPSWLKTLSNLTNIYLEGNGLHELPPTIGSCQMLDVLDLQDNQLTKLPDEFCSLRNLTSLNLRGNRIRTLPKDFGKLKALAILNMIDNGMKHLPECVCDLKSLQELILDRNLLRSLPKKIVLMPNLHYLSVSRNCLEHLPLMFFVNHTFVTFIHNAKLNYIQYELGCDLSINSFVAVDVDENSAWRLDITGCSERTPIELESGCVYIQIQADKSLLKLPESFKTLHQPFSRTKNSVPSLFELSAREAYEIIAGAKFGSSKELNEVIECVLSIPAVSRVLNGGPTARCSNVDCSEALFTEAVVWTMWMPVANGEGPLRTFPTLLLFCSTRCSRLYLEQHPKEVALNVDWCQVVS